MASRETNARIIGISKAIMLLALSGSVMAEQAAVDVLPLPEDAFPESKNPISSVTDRFVGTTGNFRVDMPDSVIIENNNGEITYDNDHKTVRYSGNGQPIRMRSDSGLDVQAQSITADMDKGVISLDGAISVYQGEMLSRAHNGTYNWKDKKLTAKDFKTKVNGLIIHGDEVEYGTDENGKEYVLIRSVRVSTDDVEAPSVWLRASELKVYPGDEGSLLGLGIDMGSFSTPGLGIRLFHSLNPEEGYMPIPGTRGIWGTYLLNRYGFLLGNRRIEDGMPVADYVLTTRADIRTRRGLAFGIDLKDCAMRSKYRMPGLSIYYINDSAPTINPTNIPRHHVNKDRYRIAMQAMWDLPVDRDPHAQWTAQTNINILSDEYVLRDFFDTLSTTNDKPDNTVRIERRTDSGSTLLWTRFAPNDFYSTDQRLELSHYHVRSVIGNSRIAYEGNSRVGVIKQYAPAAQRAEYRQRLDQITDTDQRDYYTRMLNTSAFVRANSTHELTTSFRLFGALNVTPKIGAGYTGYYDVDGIGSDHRFLGYLGCNFDLKFHRRYENVTLPWMNGRGITHVIHPYVSVSHCNVSSSNPRVPKVDVWSTTLSNSSSNPLDLDLIGFTNIDSWGTWNICRFGIANDFTTTVDGDLHNLLSWNCFIDYNAKSPNSTNSFSNFYSVVTFRPSRYYSISMQAQAPLIREGDGFQQYNTAFTVQPCSWFEASLGHSYISGHPLIKDASQAYIRGTIRVSEQTVFAGRVDWDIETKRIPIQQYGVFHKYGPWYVGATVFLRDNGGKKETGFGISFTLTETGTGIPIEFF